MLRKSPLVLFALFALLAIKGLAQTIVFTPNTTTVSSSGGNITFTATISYTVPPSVLVFSTTLPTGWSYQSGPSVPEVHPSAGNTGLLGWAYTSALPANSTSFSFTVAYPAGLNGLQPLSTQAVTRDSSESQPVTTTGPTLVLQAPPTAFKWVGNSETQIGQWTDASKWDPAGTVPNNTGLSTYSAELDRGTATISTGTSITINDLLVFGGSVNGGGMLTVLGGNSSWTSGSLSGLASLTVDSGATFSASTYATHDFDQTTIINQGTFNWRDGGALRSGSDGGFVNASGATFNDTTSGTTTDYLITNPFGGKFSFTNAGTYVKTTVGSTTRIEVPFTNSGILRVDGGTLRFTSSFIQASGAISVAAGTNAIFDNGLSLTNGTLTGSGKVTGNVVNGSNPIHEAATQVSVAGVMESAVIAPGSALGKLTIDGNLSLLSTSQLIFELGGTSQGVNYDFLSVTGNASLGGNLSVSFVNSFNQTVNSGSTFTLLSSSALSGTFADLPNGVRLATTDGAGTFVLNYTSTSVTLSNFQLVPVPEPSTWALMIAGLGVIGLGAYRRRRA